MDITPQDNTTQPISDDQELAKALAGVLPDEPEEPATDSSLKSGFQFEETPAQAPAPAAALNADGTVAAEEVATEPEVSEPQQVEVPEIEVPTFPTVEEVAPATNTTAVANDLTDIKNEALNELRPLIDHVDIPAEEKFDTYLMLLRSTDDASLIAPAHAVAKEIVDEERKAKALLDIIKEIDYLSRKDK